jgi:hydroxymethylpyrimidine pyrophosphatase-like HAD family hydrolase
MPLSVSPLIESLPADAAPDLLPACVLDAEQRFYGDYAWCLNPCLTVGEAGERLMAELARLDTPWEDWQRNEVMTNAYLLACALLNSVDDYLRGPVYQLPRIAAVIPLSRLALKTVETVRGWGRSWRVQRAAAWRQGVITAFDPFLQRYVRGSDAVETVRALADAARRPLPADLLDQYTHLPSCFRKLDLAPTDVLALGRAFIARFPDRRQPVLAVGLRTAGSYFAPLFCALLKTEGYQTVDEVTFRPDKGLGRHERKLLTHAARAGHRVAILDDPPLSGETFALAADVLRQSGFPAERIVALFPVHPSECSGRSIADSVSLAKLDTLTLEPEHWHKAQLLEPATIEKRLGEYAQQRGYIGITIHASSTAAAEFNAGLDATSEEVRRTRLKRVYEVCLRTVDGREETRFVLAKSVGVGYLAYHAFLAGSRLSGFVPPLLGLRDGLLFTEWVPQREPIFLAAIKRETWIDTIASYVAARVRRLPMPKPATLDQSLHKYNHGFELLDKVLSKAYGHSILSKLMRTRVRRRLAEQLCSAPTLIDGKMRPAEWLVGGGSLLKADFEHHGMGKNELNVVDPAYDLAEAVLQLSLSATEEDRLLARYRAESGDATVTDRLFLHKLLAGLWTMAGAKRNLQQPSLACRQVDFHREYVRAWDFLTAQTARHCGRLCRVSAPAAWRSPLVVLDVDGVIDRRIFGFPCTTAAGIQALALLHAHGMSVALNTARSVGEVKEYCAAYGCAGGVAEYGAYVWDAVGQRGRLLLSSEALRQLERARKALARLPGVFVNDGYEYSIKACTYEEGVALPLPTLLMRRLLADHDLDQLTLHQTSIDSTLVAKDVNKGTGLTALLDWIGLPSAETWAVGDSEPDLEMFRVATRSFAPGHIGCAKLARFLGCEIAPQPFQRGLLHIVQSLVHPDGGRCERCAAGNGLGHAGGDLFLDLLRVADVSRARLALQALFHPALFESFTR